MTVLILGAGAYGLALSNSIKGEVFVYSSIKDEIDLLNNGSNLFNISFGNNIHFISDINIDYDLVIIALPTNVIKSELSKLNLKNVPIVVASKGIYDGMFVYDIVKSIINSPIYVLSGPSFAKDMVSNNVLSLTVAGCIKLNIFKDNIKLEYTDDILGVEICGVLKNIFAISCGMLKGMCVSDSTFSAFLNLVINETKDILNSMGADKNTIFLSCGIGDIILTCTSSNSRNYTLGFMIGSGVSSKDIGNYLSNNTVEGINALKSFKTSNGLVNLINDIIYNGSSSYELLNYILK